MDTKRRRYFHLEDNENNVLAKGILYDEYNVQVTWRHDIGYTAEQYSNICMVLDLLPGICTLTLVPFL